VVGRTLQTSQVDFFASAMHSLQLQGLPKSQLLRYDGLVRKDLAIMLSLNELSLNEAACLVILLQFFVATKPSRSRPSILVQFSTRSFAATVKSRSSVIDGSCQANGELQI
jgi:hypothetical protein